MRIITFLDTEHPGRIVVRLDGVVLQRVALDLAQVRAAKRARMWTPKMQEDYLNQVERRLADGGVREDESKVILNRFKAEIEKA